MRCYATYWTHMDISELCPCQELKGRQAAWVGRALASFCLSSQPQLRGKELAQASLLCAGMSVVQADLASRPVSFGF